jgi:feruloyl esterase
MRTTFAVLLTVSGLFQTVDADEKAACEQLSGLKLPEAKITAATLETSGSFKSDLGQTMTGLPPFCRVTGVATPTAQSQIGFEVWLPLSNWSGRYVQVGNGGLAGIIFHPLLGQMLERGHAATSTDNGHKGNPFDGSWAIGEPEKVRDFAERAVHVTTDAGKRITAEYYGSKAKRAYFFGCSEGGREALIAAQRYPADFDGIVVGAPANYWTDLLTGFVWSSQALHKDPATFIPPDKLPLIQQAALAACDKDDGVDDGIVSAPDRCKFDPAVLACRVGTTDQCLTQPQVDALRKLYAGLRDPQSGQEIAPGYVPSGENETSAMGGGLRAYAFGGAPGASAQVLFAKGYYGGFVFENKDWDFRSFDFTSDTAKARTKLGALMDASNPDLSAFRKRGGKMIQYHGLLDGSIPPAMSVRYYDDVIKSTGGLPATQDFYRLFLAPGVLHCGFGPGANAFGNLGPRGPADAEHDTLFALEKWVEHGVAPSQIIATKYVDDDPAKGVKSTRPLCAYPRVAKWNGSGSIEKSESFSCALP